MTHFGRLDEFSDGKKERIRRRIQRIFERNGWPEKYYHEFAAELDMHPNSLAKFRKEPWKVTLLTAWRYASYFGVTLEDIYGTPERRHTKK